MMTSLSRIGWLEVGCSRERGSLCEMSFQDDEWSKGVELQMYERHKLHAKALACRGMVVVEVVGEVGDWWMWASADERDFT